jgi:hypothetical protein
VLAWLAPLMATSADGDERGRCGTAPVRMDRGHVDSGQQQEAGDIVCERSGNSPGAVIK